MSVLYMSVLSFFTYVYVCFYLYIILSCLGIQCGQQRNNLILQVNLPFHTVYMLWISFNIF